MTIDMNKGQVKYLVAVSGGVDSVVLLDVLKKQDKNIVVAHFDHGIRQDSATDAQFVADLARKYDADFFSKREELGPNVSEDFARTRRYNFLRQLAEEQNARLVTAHHLDDVIETIAINLMRGTGWRGLAVLNADDIERPLIDWQKKEIIDYAQKYNLSWREDSTNQLNVYTRNIVRRKIKQDEDARKELQILYHQQLKLAREIKSELSSLLKNLEITDGQFSRYFINSIDNASAYEISRELVRGELMPNQLDRMIVAIKTNRSGTVFEASKKIKVHFSTRFFALELIE